MDSSKVIFSILLFGAAVCSARMQADELLPIRVDDEELVFYQAKPLSEPEGGDQFKGSNFIHPLKTPSGFVVTDCQPADHLHHFGLWWPWKYIQSGDDDRKVLCWELQQGDGLIQAIESRSTPNGLVAESIYIDRKAPSAPETLLNETAKITVSSIIDQPARGYFLDLEIVHRTAGDQPITVVPYRYSGFALRATPFWNKDNSTILTSEGKDRYGANFSHARWVRVEGKTDKGGKAGVLMMSCPNNQAHPEKLRTWDKQHNGAVFVNFNTVADKEWKFEPGWDYPRNFQLFVYDGEISVSQAEELWKKYAYASKIRLRI